MTAMKREVNKRKQVCIFLHKLAGFFWTGGGCIFHPFAPSVRLGSPPSPYLFVLFYTKKFSNNEIQELLISGDRITVPGTKVL